MRRKMRWKMRMCVKGAVRRREEFMANKCRAVWALAQLAGAHCCRS